MRAVAIGDILAVRVIAGLNVVTIAWDFVEGSEAAKVGLLGFAIERSEVADDGGLSRTHWLRGTKRFKDLDNHLPPGASVPTNRHPVQSFQWGDYVVDPDIAYRYRVVPAYSDPLDATLKDDWSIAVDVRTEREEGSADTPDKPRHDIYFNRGVAGSQAYVRLFPDQLPNENEPLSEQMVWLSRGLFEALTGFIGLAAGSDAAEFKLRAMLYEFRYDAVGQAFKDAAAAGADVDVRYEAQSYKVPNGKMIDALDIGDICKPQKSRQGIRHNKFIVLIHRDTPIGVWTGSTNISAGGIFGHSNVGHIVWGHDIAQTYLDYWERLAKPDVTLSKLRTANQETEPGPDSGAPPADRILTLFSPRDPADPDTTSPTLNWYADLLASAKQIACMTFAFSFDPVFQRAVLGETEALSYLLFDKAMDGATETQVRRNRNTVFAVGSKLKEGDVENTLGEVLTGFNSNLYIHDKFLLIDPLGDDPIVVTGTANFSETSQEKNDENMLVIRGDTRVADIYFGEFMRIFNHLYYRYIVDVVVHASEVDEPEAGYLKVDTARWLPSHFRPGPKAKRRRFFMGATS